MMESDRALTERSRPWPVTDPTTTTPSPRIPPPAARTAWPTALPGRCTARSPDARAVPAPRQGGCAPNAEPEPPGLSAAPTATDRIPKTAHAAADASVPEAPRPAVPSPTVLASRGPVVAVPNADPPRKTRPERKEITSVGAELVSRGAARRPGLPAAAVRRAARLARRRLHPARLLPRLLRTGLLHPRRDPGRRPVTRRPRPLTR